MLNKETLLLVNAFLTGGLIKLYDDIKDNDMISDEDEVNNPKMTILKIIIIVLFSIMSMLDSNFLFVSVFVAFPLSIYSGGMDTDFWYLLFYISCIALLLNIDKIMQNIPDKLVLLIITGSLIMIETKLFPEEKSDRKTNFRYIFTVLGILSIYVFKDSSYNFISLFMTFWVGYGLSNLLFQHFFLNDSGMEDSSSINI
jgi:hypothetical protein